MNALEKSPLLLRTWFWFASALLLISAQSSCVSTRYKSARKDVPPAASLNLNAAPGPSATATNPTTEVCLNSVILFQSPGSWKREAYWDEYVVTIANRSGSAVTVDSVMLSDFDGVPVPPGTDPWELEKQSRSHAARLLTGTGTALKIGGGAVATTVGGVLGGAGAASGGGFFAALAGAGVGAIVVIPVFAGVTIYGNVSNKHRIEEQFRYRRLNLPLVLAPGQSAHGSFFFRITPNPQRFTLRSTMGASESTDHIVQLAPFARSLPYPSSLSDEQKNPERDHASQIPAPPLSPATDQSHRS